MKVRDIFLSAVLLLFVNEVDSKQNGASLNSLIQELAPIARLTNGIAMETELFTDLNKMNEVVAEFLGIGSGEGVAKLKGLKVDEVTKELKELYVIVEKVPELKVDMSELTGSFKALETMKQSSAVLGNRSLTDPTAELTKIIEEAKTVGITPFTSFDHWKIVVAKLTYIKNTPVEDITTSLSADHLEPLKLPIFAVLNQLDALKAFEQKLNPVFKLEGMGDRLKEFSAMLSISQLFVKNSDTFTSMAAKLSELGKGVNNLKPVMAKEKVLPSLAKGLGDSSAAVRKLMSTPPALQLSAGFSGRIDDLKLMLEDLEGPVLKKLISGGKSTEDLKKYLTTTAGLHSKLQPLRKVWTQLAQKKKVDASEELATVLASTFGNDQKPIDATGLADSLDSIGQCFVDLKPSAADYDYEEGASLVKYATELGERTKALRTFLEQKKSDFEALPPKLSELSKLLAPFEKAKYAEIPIFFKAIQNYTELDSVIKSSKGILDEFEKIKGQSPFTTLDESVKLTVISAVLGSLNGTNVDVMLDCLQKTSFDSTELEPALKFGQSVQVMKSKKTEVESVQAFLKELAKVKTGLLEIQKLTAAAQKNTLRRRRRALNQKSLANLKNAQIVATDLGKGVQVLREFVKILENEASVKVAVEANGGLKAAISAIPEAQSVWTDENRKEMSKMLVDLNDLDKFSGNLKKDNMSSLWTVFDKAQIPGVAGVDAKLFDNPISTALATSSDPKIKGTSGDFKKLGTLDLNFVQHKNYLKAAAVTLHPLQKFFDDIFDISKPLESASVQPVTVLTSDSGTVTAVSTVLGGIALFVGVGVGAFLFKRRQTRLKEKNEKIKKNKEEEEKMLKKKKEVEDEKKKKEDEKWENRERYLIYDDFFNNRETWMNLPMAVKDKKFSTAKELIEAGCFVNIYDDGYTALHYAIKNALPEVVEYLILHGADRTLSCCLKLDALGLVAHLLKNEKDVERKKNLHKIEEVFKKYEKCTFRPKIRDLIPLSMFNIEIISTDPKLEKVVQDFKKTYDEYLLKDRSMKSTHVVVDTDEDGCFNFDKALIAKRAKIQADIEKQASSMTNSTKEEREALEPSPNVDDPDDLDSYDSFFSNCIIVKASWLAECLKNKAAFYNDYNHRVTKVRLNNKVYETVDEWKKWLRHRALECLWSVEIYYDFDRKTEKFEELFGRELMRMIVERLGATFFYSLDDLVIGSSERTKPSFWFPDKKRQWIVYSSVTNKKEVDHNISKVQCENEADRHTVITKMSVIEFFEFLISMNGLKDLKVPPTPPHPLEDGKTTKPTTSKAANV